MLQFLSGYYIVVFEMEILLSPWRKSWNNGKGGERLYPHDVPALEGLPQS